MTERLPQGHCVQCKTGVIKDKWLLCRDCRKNPRPITYGLRVLTPPKSKLKEKILRHCEKINCPAMISRGKYCMAHGDESAKQANRRLAEKRKLKEQKMRELSFFNTNPEQKYGI